MSTLKPLALLLLVVTRVPDNLHTASHVERLRTEPFGATVSRM
jgi:hypothetical protein